MDKKENTTDFDLSILSYKELVDLHYMIDDFLEELSKLNTKYEIKEDSNE